MQVVLVLLNAFLARLADEVRVFRARLDINVASLYAADLRSADSNTASSRHALGLCVGLRSSSDNHRIQYQCCDAQHGNHRFLHEITPLGYQNCEQDWYIYFSSDESFLLVVATIILENVLIVVEHDAHTVLPPVPGTLVCELEPLPRDFLGATRILDPGLLQNIEFNLIQELYLLFWQYCHTLTPTSIHQSFAAI